MHVRVDKASKVDKDPGATCRPSPSLNLKSSRMMDMDSRILFQYPNDPNAPQSVAVMERDLDFLPEGRFLNDTLIDFGLQCILHHSNSRGQVEQGGPVHLFSSFTYAKICRYYNPKAGYDESFGFGKGPVVGSKIFTKSSLILPINEDNHWYLAIIFITQPFWMMKREGYGPSASVVILDSLAVRCRPLAEERIKRFLQHQARCELEAEGGDDRCIVAKGKVELDLVINVIYPLGPKQENSVDCGCFVLEFAAQFLRSPVNFIHKALIDRDLRGLFTAKEAGTQRSQLEELIKKLMIV